MKHFMGVLFLVGLVMAPMAQANAGFLIEGSLGKGAYLNAEDPEPTWGQTNLMVAPGYGLLANLIRLQLGLVADMPDVKDSEFDLQLRPMVTIRPPLLPLYARAVFAFQNLLGDGDTVIAYGGVLGLGFSIPVVGIGAFVEAGILPTNIKGVDKTYWMLEGRGGVSYAF